MEESTPLLGDTERVSCWSRLRCWKRRSEGFNSRLIRIGRYTEDEFPSNYICNQKYNIWTFIPLVLYEQFKLFQNFYFLVMAISQFIPAIRIGYLYTYWGPLGFVIAATTIREFIDDFRRYRQDKEVNTQLFERIVLDSQSENLNIRTYATECVAAASLRVGDIVLLQKGQRVPADMLLLRTSESLGSVYIRTDQLDGETDWKLRIPVHATQKLHSDSQLINTQVEIFVEKPEKDIHSFIGTIKSLREDYYDSLDVSNTMWSGCVLASGHATGLVMYTGVEMRCMMKKSTPRSKVGRLDYRVNNITKVLFLALIFLSFFEIFLKGFSGPWYRYLFRFVLLMSYIIPISLRVNLDMAKAIFSWFIQRDKNIPGCVVRSTTIPEELGRIKYMMVDKTGTLTKNEMLFKKIYIGGVVFHEDNFHEVESLLTQYVTKESNAPPTPIDGSCSSDSSNASIANVSPTLAWETVRALALCHNVTPVYNNNDDASQSDMSEVSESCGGAVPQQELCEYQAASPDEVALVKWTDRMGVSLYTRDLDQISLKLRAANSYAHYDILDIFPFNSETKMMGIVVKDNETDSISYYVKGADDAICPLLDTDSNYGTNLAECSARLAADGLRTLVYAKKSLTPEEYQKFKDDYKEAKRSKRENIKWAMRHLHSRLMPLGVSGVEDRLADRVPITLTMLRNAGIKIWMLTGDKVETAFCIVRGLPLARGNWSIAPACKTRTEAYRFLESVSPETDLIIEGDTLDVCLRDYYDKAVSVLEACDGVTVARCSPSQKARAVRVLRQRGHAVAAAGDGGNDVPMIREADMGIGVEGAEGRAASLAGDVSVTKFCHVANLLLVHGRRCAMRSANLCLFIVHRGLIISIMQALFSCVFYFSSVSIYPGLLMVGYGTIYTMLPVFSLVLDKDLPGETLLKHPHLYKQVVNGKQLSTKICFVWTAISIYQGSIIMYGALILFEGQLIHIVAISYTSLILTELAMVALTIITWHRIMFIAELLSLLLYILTLVFLNSYFDADFIRQWDFIWRVTVLTFVSCLPLFLLKTIAWFQRRKHLSKNRQSVRC